MQRDSFGTKFGFIAAAAGSAVGLGNIWRFPYEAGENGAILVFYIFAVFFICLPIMAAEIAIGRNTQLNTYGAFRKLGQRYWGIFGLFGILCSIIILSFYNVVAGWAIGYLVKFISGAVTQAEDLAQFFGGYAANATQVMIHSVLFMALTVAIVIGGIKKGIERWASTLMPTLIIMMIGLAIYAMTLPGAVDGLKFYLIPNLEHFSGKTVLSAMSQAFFSLSLGIGLLVTYGSYVNKQENLVQSAAIIALADTFIALLAGLLIFPLVFSQGLEPTAGPGLVFITLPGVFLAMGPLVGKVVGSIFFLLLCFAAITSTISLLEMSVAYLSDQFSIKRKIGVPLMALIVFIIGIPSIYSQGASHLFTNFIHYGGNPHSFLDLMNDVFSEIAMPLGGFLISIFTIYRWGYPNFAAELQEGNSWFKGSASEHYVKIVLTFISPLIVGALFIIQVLHKIFNVAVF